MRIRQKILPVMLVALLVLAFMPIGAGIVYAEEGNDSIVGLKIVTPPERTYYPINETIDSKGIKVVAVFESGSEATLSSGYTVSCDTSSLGKHDAIVSYTAGDKTFDVSFEVIVDDEIIADGRDTDSDWPTGITWTLNSNGTLTINGTGTIGATGDYGWSEGEKCWTRLQGVGSENGLYAVKKIIFNEGMKGTSNFLFDGYKGLKEVQFPESFEHISGFSNSGLETFNIPENVKYVGMGTFSGTPWWDNQSPGLVYKDDVLLGWKDLCPDDIVVKNGTRLIAGQAFQNCTNIQSIVIPNTVKKGEGGGILNGCSSLKKAILPAEVSLSFSDCEAIEEVTYTGTGDLTFAFNYSRARALKKVIFEDGVSGIGDNTFMGCSALEYVEIPSTVTSIGRWSFEGCTNLTIYTPKDSYAYKYATENSIKVVAIEDKQAADKVSSAISELPDTISSTDVKAIKEVLSEYNLLSEEQKALVSETLHEKLNTAVLDADQFEHFWEVDYTIDKNTTCTEDGSRSIHCSVCDAIDDSSVEVIPKTNHEWDASTYTWSKDYKTVTATRICKHDSTHNETETVKTTAKVTKAATYTAKGQTTYTAVFTNDAFSKQTKVVTNVPQLAKKANTLTVKPRTATVKFSKVKKKTQTVKRAKALTVSKPQGTVTYKLTGVTKAKFKKYFKVNAKTGNITVKKKLKKGTYKLKIKVTAAGTTAYKAGSKTVTTTIKVK